MSDIRAPIKTMVLDRLLDCEEAREVEIQDLIGRAMKAGWDEEGASGAIACRQPRLGDRGGQKDGRGNCASAEER